MILDTLKRFNWLDIFVIIFWLRICYIAAKTGFLTELFKVLGSIGSIYLSLHYFSGLSDFVRERLPTELMPVEFVDFLCFIFLAALGYFVFFLLRKIIVRFVKMEAVPKLSRWGGIILGVIRPFLVTSIIIFAMVMSSVVYFKRSVAVSYSGEYLFKVAPGVYSALWNGLLSKFMIKETFNQTVLDIQLTEPPNE